MRKIIYLLVLFSILLSCKQKEETSPPIPITYRGLRMPDCSNRVGEGQWEHFNDSETSVLITPGFENPEVQDTSYVSNIHVSEHNFLGYIGWHQKKPVTLILAAYYPDNTLVLGAGSDSLGSFKEMALAPAAPTTPTPAGCYRVYYFFTVMNGTKYRIVDKGHFDLSYPY